MAEDKTGTKARSSRRQAHRRRAKKEGRWGRLLLLALLVAVGVASYLLYDRIEPRLGDLTQTVTGMVQTEEQETVTLYFAHPKWTKLLGEKRTIAKIADPVKRLRTLVELLIEGPQGEAQSVLPADAKVKNVYLGPGGRVMIDFAPTLDELRSYGVASEMVSVFAIVHTLSENDPKVSSVQILIDGKTEETLAGHVRISEPLKPRPDMVGDGT